MSLNYFKWSEFACKHCGENEFDEGFAEKVDMARHYAGIPFVLNSAYRCPKHNDNIGSVSDVHPKGLAVDINTPDSRTRFLVLWALIQCGFKRIGIHKGFIHVDDDTTKDRSVAWVY